MLGSYSLFWKFRAHETVGSAKRIALFWNRETPQPLEVCPSGASVAVSVISSSNMASSGGVVRDGDFMRHAEYTPKSSGQNETDIDKRLGGCLMAVGLGVAAAGFAGRYAFHLWRPLSQVITEATKKLPTAEDPRIWQLRSMKQKICLTLALAADPAARATPTETYIYFSAANSPTSLHKSLFSSMFIFHKSVDFQYIALRSICHCSSPPL
uniref:DnaJ (Hsp40) homolog, subfamily C, member 15 n=1 Tax=Cyprinus carpio carpio TaxID=630221 RepID=A0A9J7Y1E6_CYPCA